MPPREDFAGLKLNFFLGPNKSQGISTELHKCDLIGLLVFLKSGWNPSKQRISAGERHKSYLVECW